MYIRRRGGLKVLLLLYILHPALLRPPAIHFASGRTRRARSFVRFYPAAISTSRYCPARSCQLRTSLSPPAPRGQWVTRTPPRSVVAYISLATSEPIRMQQRNIAVVERTSCQKNLKARVAIQAHHTSRAGFAGARRR
jgi:hypothetical protein